MSRKLKAPRPSTSGTGWGLRVFVVAMTVALFSAPQGGTLAARNGNPARTRTSQAWVVDRTYTVNKVVGRSWVVDEAARTDRIWQKVGTRETPVREWKQVGTRVETRTETRTVYVPMASYQYTRTETVRREETRYRERLVPQQSTHIHEVPVQVTRTITVPGSWHIHAGSSHTHAGYWYTRPGSNHWHSGGNHYHGGSNHTHCWWFCWNHWHGGGWHYHGGSNHYHCCYNHYHGGSNHYHGGSNHYHHSGSYHWHSAQRVWAPPRGHWHGPTNHFHPPQSRTVTVTVIERQTHMHTHFVRVREPYQHVWYEEVE